MDLEFEVHNQTLKRLDKNKTVNGSFNYLKIGFTFKTSDWEGLDKYALFFTRSKVYRVDLLHDKLTVPHEVLKGDRFVFSLFGMDSEETTRITSNKALIYLDISGYTPDFEDYIEDDGDFPDHHSSPIDERIRIIVNELREEISVVGFSNDYDDLDNKPDISNLSGLEVKAGFRQFANRIRTGSNED